MSDPSPLWTAQDAAAATGGAASRAWAATGVAIDSREVAPGDLFVALEGPNRDGHAYVAGALAAGAAAAMVARRPDDVSPDAPLLTVADTFEALRALGAAGRARLGPEAQVIGVTGSVGKTGTKEMLRAMLSPQGPAHAAARSFNNHWGVPLTLARMARDTRFAAIEMGMNHAGEIAPLSRLARPHVALITTVEAVHIENFADEAGIADAKAEIFAGLAPGGVAVLNRDNRWFGRVRAAAEAAGARIVAFGASPDAAARLLSAEAEAGGTRVAAEIDGLRVAFGLAAPGRHLALNAVAALACVAAAGGDVALAAEAAADWRPPAGRGARWRVDLPGGGAPVLLIDESYNANPASVGAALEVLAATPAEGRRIAVLGDMFELGAHEEAMHAGLADHHSLQGLDAVATVGERMRALDRALPADRRLGWFADAEAAGAALAAALGPGDAVMVKGSNAMRMGRVVEAVKAAGRAAPAEDA